MRSSLLSSALVLMSPAGCSSGAVKLDGGEDFGEVRSAVWLEIRSEDGGTTRVDHTLVLSDQRRFCSKAETALHELADLYGSFEELYQDLYAEDAEEAQCRYYKEVFAQMADIYDPLLADGARMLFIDAYGDGKPEERTYEVREDLSAVVNLYSANSYREFYNNLACDPAGLSYVSNSDQGYDVFTTYGVSEGSLEVTRATNRRIEASLTGQIEYSEGGPLGEIRAQGSFDHCVIKVEGDATLDL